jgi:hypothetical protein
LGYLPGKLDIYKKRKKRGSVLILLLGHLHAFYLLVKERERKELEAAGRGQGYGAVPGGQ